MKPNTVILKMTEELAQQLEKTNEHDGRHYYAHNDHIHRIVWVLEQPAEQLINQCIQVNISAKNYASKKLTLPEYVGRPHLHIRMTGLADEQWEPRPIDQVLEVAPRDRIVGRRPKVKSGTTIKAHVTTEVAEAFRELGKGNLAEGIRIAGELLICNMVK